MADGELTMFGKAYDTVGSTNKNLILLTRGDLKVRWGNKYIDLIKNGKINVDVDFIKKVDDKEEIFKDGIYIVEKDDNLEVWLYSGGTLINLIGEVGTTYVSFIGTQDVDAEKKFLALINAGFYYKTYSDAEKASIKSGLIYIDDQHQLYYAKEGKLYKYEQALTVPDPLVVGNITIDGKSSRISGGAGLSLGVGTADYISFTDKGVNVLKPLTTTDVVASDTFEHNKTGYSIYYDPIRNWHCMEIDYILVRNLIDYGGIEDILYDDLVAKVENRGLAKGKKYRITDFQNEWEIEDIYYDSENKPYYYYWPVILTAKSENEFEDYGYFCDNKKWIIKYDINYHYYINSGVNTEGNYWILYTKGRITELSDEYGNVCNYDFKHRKFKRFGSENLTLRLFTFNVVNTEKGNDYRDPISFRNIHDNWDATQIDEVKVKNNIINIKEPSYEGKVIINKEGQLEVVLAAVIYDECFLFLDCRSIYPHDNEIKKSSGKYIMFTEFYNNKISGFILNIENRISREIKYQFFNNTFENIYILGEPSDIIPLTSQKEVIFIDYKEYSNNSGLDIINTLFKDNTKKNTFLNIKDVLFDKEVESNIFEKDLFEVHFYCSLKLNKFLGKIDTDSALSSNRETYSIKGILENNTFNEIIKTYIDGIIKNNQFHDLKPFDNGTLTRIEADINDCTINDLIGTKFEQGTEVNDCIINDLIKVEVKQGVKVQNVVGYDEEYYVRYDIENVIIYGNIDKLNFRGKIINVDFKNTISKVYFYGKVGTDSNRSIFAKISDTNFYKDVLKLNADSSDIRNCEFNGEVTEANIRGNVSNCSFMRLSGNINIGLAEDSLSDMIIQIDIYPSISLWAQAENNPSKLISCSPLQVNPTAVPRLKATARKECFVQTINPGEKKAFIVRLSTDDTNPSGVIIMFYPGILNEGLTIADVIPKGYAICDGNNGTPDLRGRFIRMIDDDNGSWEAIGKKNNDDLSTDINGNTTRKAYIQIHDYNLPRHLHHFDMSADVDISGVSVSNYSGSDSDTYYYYLKSLSTSVKEGEGASKSTGDTVSRTSGTVSIDISHGHTLNGSPVLTNIVVTLDDSLLTYDNKKINVEPEAYALIFIMKL